MTRFRIGLDFGGTKTEIAALAPDGALVARRRIPTPGSDGQGTYEDAVRTLAELTRAVESEIGEAASVGIGIPGVINPETGRVKNANSIRINGHPFPRDISAALGREVRVGNDANCFTLSEAVDGAGAGQDVVFGVIVGTGCGAGIVVQGRLIEGRHHIAGEWGHTPLPWPAPEELPGRPCWCGRSGCLETWIAGPSLAYDCDGPGHRDAHGITDRAAAGEERARAALARHADRMARGLAAVVDLLDPDAIVLGGGLSNMAHLYEELPGLIRRYAFGGATSTPVARNRHGDSSGVRGAAWLWPKG